MSVGSMVGGGVRLVRTKPQVVAIWAALYLAAMLIGMMLMRPWLGELAAFQQQAAANAAAGIATPPVFPAGWFGGLFLFELAFLVLLVVAFAAVVRAVAWPTGDRFAYPRFGMDELRLIGLCVLLGIAAIVVEIGAILAVALLAWLGALVGGQGAGFAIAVVLWITLLCAAIYVQVRLSLTGALTMLRGRIVLRDAWRATKGHFWQLFGAYLLLSIAAFLLSILAIAVVNPHLLAAYASLDGRAITAAAQEQMARQQAGFSVALIVQAVIGAIVGVVMGAVFFGAIATAALELGEGTRPEGGSPLDA